MEQRARRAVGYRSRTFDYSLTARHWIRRGLPDNGAGRILARPSDMDPQNTGNRITRGRGRIEAGHFAAEAGYDLHRDPSGRPLFVVFDEHPDDLPDGTLLRLTLAEGRVLTCQVLGDSPLCSIVSNRDGQLAETETLNDGESHGL